MTAEGIREVYADRLVAAGDLGRDAARAYVDQALGAFDTEPESDVEVVDVPPGRESLVERLEPRGPMAPGPKLKLFALGRPEVPELVIRCRPSPSGRVTGWSILCPECPPAPVDVQSRGAATSAAVQHARQTHAGRVARVVVSEPRRRGRRRG